jgi:hypothetical protein
MPKSLYVLELSNKKYLIGTTTKTSDEVIIDYWENYIPWADKSEPIKVIEFYEIKDNFEEDKKTLYYMEVYGIDNVRGGSFMDDEFSDDKLAIIRKMIDANIIYCKKCKTSDHATKDCNKLNKPNDIIDLKQFNSTNSLVISDNMDLYREFKKEANYQNVTTLIFPFYELFKNHTISKNGTTYFRPIMGLSKIKTIVFVIDTSNYSNFIKIDLSYLVNLETIIVKMYPDENDLSESNDFNIKYQQCVANTKYILDTQQFHNIEVSSDELDHRILFGLNQKQTKGAHKGKNVVIHTCHIIIKTEKKTKLFIIKGNNLKQIIKQII